MKKILYILCFCFSSMAYGQISNMSMNGVPARVTPYTDIDGSPYLFPDWEKAQIATTNGGIKSGVSYKFNIHDNVLEVINEAGNTIYLNKDFLEYAVLERPSELMNDGNVGQIQNLLFKKGFDVVDGVAEKDLVNVLAEGENYTLIRKFYSDLVTPPKNSYSPSPGQMFVFEESFYLISSTNEVQKVRAKTGNIVKALNQSDQAEAKKIIKENKLNLSREDHLVIFFGKLNEA